jgi:hypothetical protein
MALITVEKTREIVKERNTIHKKVDCTYTIFFDSYGNKYLQLDTYGSDDRKIAGKTSQSIQFNKESIRLLNDIISKEFD